MNATPVQIAAKGEAGDAQDERNRDRTGYILFWIGMGVLAVIGVAAMVNSQRDNPNYLP